MPMDRSETGKYEIYMQRANGDFTPVDHRHQEGYSPEDAIRRRIDRRRNKKQPVDEVSLYILHWRGIDGLDYKRLVRAELIPPVLPPPKVRVSGLKEIP